MSTTHTLDYVRFTRQVNTDPIALLSTDVAARQAYTLLQAALWKEETDKNASFPARAAVLESGTPSSLFDAYKYCGDYADGKQKAYAGAVAYRFQIPAEALTGTVAEVVSVAVPLYVDRWLVDGVRIAAYVSDDETPPASWATVRDGDAKLSARLPMTYTEDDPPKRVVVEKNGTMTVTMPADLDSKKYLYVMVTLEDYESVRGFWIEGAGLLIGGENVVTFDRSVTADPDLSADYVQPIASADFIKTLLFGFPDRVTGTYLSYAFSSAISFEDSGTGGGGEPILQLFDVDTGLIRTAAALNQMIMTPIAEAASQVDQAITEFSIVTGFPGRSGWEIYIRRSLFMLNAVFHTPDIIRKITIPDAIGSYPDWLRVRLNIYAMNDSSSVTSDTLPTTVFGYASALTWRNGTYSANGLSNLLSVELSPAGYAANSMWSTKPFSAVAGVTRLFVTIELSRVVAEPDADIITNGESFGLTWQADKMLIN